MRRFPTPITNPAEHVRAAREGRYQDLVLWHCPLAISIVERYWGDKDEMISIAYETLCRAARKWDPDHPKAIKTGFRGYVGQALRNELGKYFDRVTRERQRTQYLGDLIIKGRHGERWLTYEELVPDLTPSPATQVIDCLDVRIQTGVVKRRIRKAGPTLINRILQFLEYGPATVPQIADHVGATPGGVRTQVKQLVVNGEATPIGKVPSERGLRAVVYARA
jgi:hypothetical protein